MAKTESVLFDDDDHCYVCGSPNVECHHVLYGVRNRSIADDYGYVIYLCHEHHRGQTGAHFNLPFNLYLKKKAQMHFENNHGTREDFIRIFGKSYL